MFPAYLLASRALISPPTVHLASAGFTRSFYLLTYPASVCALPTHTHIKANVSFVAAIVSLAMPKDADSAALHITKMKG